MHTIEELDPTDFEYRVNGDQVSRSDVMPPITLLDRVGVVMGSGPAGIGAGNFVLSCITAFYDRLSETKENFFEYPDYYTFQTTTEPADYRMLDIYPDHKNVALDSDAEELLRAINDRAITVLLVPEGQPQSHQIEDITLRSAERRIDHCYVYAPDAHLNEEGFVIRTPRQPVEEWYRTTVRSDETTSGTYTLPSIDSRDDIISQAFRRISHEEALARLPA